jgi:hypothetical protein
MAATVNSVFEEAAINHGLYWGIEIGDSFNYHLTIRRTDSSGNYDIDYYIVLNSLPTIPENMTESPRLGSSSANEWNNYFSFYFVNDTEITPQTSGPTLHWSAYPLGNWSLVEEYALSEINTTLWDVQQVNTETEWGLTMTADERIAIHTDTVRYSKDEGALNFLEMDWQYVDGGFRTVRYIRVGEGAPLQLVIGVAGVSIGALAIALVVIKKRQSLKSI